MNTFCKSKICSGTQAQRDSIYARKPGFKWLNCERKTIKISTRGGQHRPTHQGANSCVVWPISWDEIIGLEAYTLLPNLSRFLSLLIARSLTNSLTRSLTLVTHLSIHSIITTLRPNLHRHACTPRRPTIKIVCKPQTLGRRMRRRGRGLVTRPDMTRVKKMKSHSHSWPWAYKF